MSPPFRAEHIGSLKRPARLLDARAKYENGEITKSTLEEIEDEEIRIAVKMQQRLGFKGITDGEYRRRLFYDGFFENLEGITLLENPEPHMFMDYAPDMAVFKASGLDFSDLRVYVCTGKIRRTKGCYVPAFVALAKEVTPEDVKNLKVTMCAPEWYHLRHGSKYAYSADLYSNDADYFADIAKAYQEELEDLYQAGCRNIQIDDPILAYFCDPRMLGSMKKVDIDPDALLDAYIKLYNDCLSTRRLDMNVGLHLCRGNYKDGVHFSEGGYDVIAGKLFNQLNVDCYYLEYDTPRAGSFDPLRQVPKHKSVILGLISSKLAALENKAQIISRIEEAAVAMGDPGKERICLSPQCGFSSALEGNNVTDAQAEEKLALVMEIAKEVWGTQ